MKTYSYLLIIFLTGISIFAFNSTPSFADTSVSIVQGASSGTNAACVTANNCFTPNPVTVSPGETITWTNTDSASHTVTSGKSDNSTGNIVASVFDSGLLGPGKTFSHTFTASDAGTINYFCQVHPWMTGQVIVSGRSTPPTTLAISNINPRIVDNFGNPLAFVKINQPIQITSDITNLQNTDQPFTFDVEIFKDGIMVSHNWISGVLTAGQTLDPAQSWTPTTSGTYTAQISILASKDNPMQLAQPLSTTIIVESLQSTPTITVTTDKLSYSAGDTIVISGAVKSIIPGAPVTIQILNANNNLVSVGQIDVSQDGTYSEIVTTTNPLWKSSGTYTVKIQYGPAVTSQTTFSFSVASLTSTITVSTDKASYSYGDSLIISGSVSNYIYGTPVSVIVRNSAGNVVQISQVDVASDKTYSTTITANTSVWQTAGIYEVDAQYGSAINSAKTTFQFSGASEETSSPSGNTSIMKASSKDGSEQVIVTYSPNPPTNGQPLSITLTFTDAYGKLINHQNYAISVTQDGNEIFSNTAGHTHTGNDMQITTNLASSDSVDIKITLNGIGLPGTDPATWTGPKGDVIYFPNIGVSGSESTQQNENTPIPITVYTDKETYDHNSIIMVSGHVRNPLGQNVGMKVISPSGNAVSAAQLTVDNNGDFATKLNTNSPLWAENGAYTIYVQQGDMQDRTSKVQVEISSELPSQPSSGIYIVMSQGASSGQACVTANNCFDPANAKVAVGDTVTWTNEDTASHTVTSGKPDNSTGNIVAAVFDSGLVKASGTFAFKFTEYGTYNYFCQVHPWMTGQIIVKGGENEQNQNENYNSGSVFTATEKDMEDISNAKSNQTIAAEVNVGSNQSQTTSIDSNVSVQTTINNPDSLESKVSAPDQTGPKVIMFNLPATTINVANLKDLGVMYDGKLISPAPNMDAILHAKSTDSPSFAIVVTQSGVQVLVLIPHFSTHTITIVNMTKVIPAVPEFGSITGMIVIISVIGVLITSRKVRFQ